MKRGFGYFTAGVLAFAGSASARQLEGYIPGQSKELEGIEIRGIAYPSSPENVMAPIGNMISIPGSYSDGGFSVNVGDVYSIQAQGPHLTPLPSAGLLGLAGLLAAGSIRRRR